MKQYRRALALFLCLLTLFSLPAAAATEKVTLTAITTQGFTVDNFDGDNTYYLCYPASFEDISITSIKTNVSCSYSLSVERYCDYDYPASYQFKEKMKLGYGRARISLTVTADKDPTDVKTYLFTLTDPKQSAYRYRRFADTVTVYENNSTASKAIATLQKGTSNSTMPLCIETKGKWTRIVIPSGYTRYHGQIGWVETRMLVEEYEAADCPKEYTKAISALQKAHPTWTFEYRYMGLDMDDYAKTIGDIYYRNSGKKADEKEILSAMDPAGFLNEQNVFMFLDVTRYQAQDYTEKGVGALWSELKGAACTKKQAVQYLLSAGKSLQTNAYYLTARAALESGHGTSKLAKGIAGTDGRLYYNFYGIKAYDKDPSTGAVYAERRNWDSPLRSIVEGGNWINDQYFQRGQNTPYFLRFYPYKDHLYMSDLKAPQKDAANLYKCYQGAGKLNSDLHFIIPIYETRYNDVAPKAWYYEDVYRATEYGLFEGMEHGGFEPESTLTRAQFVTVISRVAGANVKGMSVDHFTDVPKKAWYMPYVAWGFDSGISHGISETEFAPERPITRQELCTMLVRYANSQEIEMTESKPAFTDNKSIASWAKSGVAYCAGSGLVNGMPDGSFRPAEGATRAQGAKILSLFYENFVLTAKAEAAL